MKFLKKRRDLDFLLLAFKQNEGSELSLGGALVPGVKVEPLALNTLT